MLAVFFDALWETKRFFNGEKSFEWIFPQFESYRLPTTTEDFMNETPTFIERAFSSKSVFELKSCFEPYEDIQWNEEKLLRMIYMCFYHEYMLHFSEMNFLPVKK